VPEQDLTSLVTAYWQHHELSGDREQRLQAEELFWAWEAVDEAVQPRPQADTLSLLDALLEASGADAFYVGAGPVEDLLDRYGAQVQEALAQRCRTSASWRQAVGCVWLDVPLRQCLPLLAEYLPPLAARPAGSPSSTVSRKTSRDRGQVRRRARRAPGQVS